MDPASNSEFLIENSITGEGGGVLAIYFNASDVPRDTRNPPLTPIFLRFSS